MVALKYEPFGSYGSSEFGAEGRGRKREEEGKGWDWPEIEGGAILGCS